MTTPAGYHSIRRTAAIIKPGDLIQHLDGTPARIRRVGEHRDAFGWVEDFDFEDDHIPFTTRLGEYVTVLLPFPKIGDGATVQVGSDSYPFTVTYVSAAGAKILLCRDEVHVVSGSFQNGDAVIDYTPKPDGIRHAAHWSQRRGCYLQGGGRVAIGVRRYYQDPSF